MTTFACCICIHSQLEQFNRDLNRFYEASPSEREEAQSQLQQSEPAHRSQRLRRFSA
ncbi:MAG: hypothetical protein R3B47_05395 [Bacteroidia bacterium]